MQQHLNGLGLFGSREMGDANNDADLPTPICYKDR